MRLKIVYPTKERKYHSEHTYQNITKQVELEPVRILREPCGRGKAANRYYYSAWFKAPKDAEYVDDGLISEPICRKDNLHFKPKQFEWIGNVCNV